MSIRALVLALLLVPTLALTGCAGGLGAKRYACEGLPSRPLCLSTAEIYALTDGDGPPPAERRLQQENAQ
ncbi:hypothetical protein [Thiorhodovibrio frisius]|uniref:Type IV conjugative transfer system lipoprotein (TraV) n=1 Tax=Thiorhodovibrio frisius TaxID=631362 RepID=H8YVS6_9GAMM|nr:hypothetical protein [Thiorhodovibrio frisius]EIC24016.1 Type IV conjugative transfer system lipoprotein (TraV) [Thiorhodovibrio frisius]WPL23088.1 hypothetical protein Thiofri_03270 [Thiorhodovibrio frisius]